jgi:uncharacterized iron-regulated protein
VKKTKIQWIRGVILSLLWLFFYGALEVSGQAARWDYPSLENSLSIREGRSGNRLGWAEWIDQLSSADMVFLGESHDDDVTHRLQLAVYQALLIAREGNVVLSLEMFERDVQTQLDDYLTGNLDEPEFLRSSRPWNNYQEAYRPLIELAKQQGKPVVAANFPRPLLMAVNQTGLAGLGAQRSLAPAELYPNSELYWKRADNATRSHSQFMTVETDPESRLKSTQSLWDNAMGEACVLAVRKNPGFQILHLNGGFHTQYFDGTAAQVRQRAPEMSLLTVAIVPASFPQSAQLQGEPVADYVVFVEDRAKNPNEGSRKIVVGRENGYWLHVPDWASAKQPAPLLIWLSDDGLSPQENLDYWKARLGSQAAIAVIEPTHRQQERDLSLSGRWFWPDRFAHDINIGLQTVEGCWQYVLNRFPVDPQRVCVAGEGTGGTLSSATAMLTGKMEIRAIAWGPRQFAKLKDFPLQLPENWGNQSPPQRSLQVFGKDQDQAWWEQELREYQSVGMATEWQAISDDPWQVTDQQQNALLSALGLPTRDTPTKATSKRYLIAETSSAKERLWLKMLAEKLADDQTRIAVLPRAVVQLSQREWDAENPDQAPQPLDWELRFQQIKQNIPLCPGPFGGTTVLILDPEQAEDLEPWLNLETQDPLQLRSRFHRTRIAVLGDRAAQTREGSRSVPDVLTKLLAENRKNVLLVPARFYADDRTVSAIAGDAEAFEDQMTLQFLPGIGGKIEASGLRVEN